MHIGERIRAKRKVLGLTQGDLARSFGISHVSVSEWERGLGKPDQDKLPALAKKLQTTVNYLLTGRDDGQRTDEKPPSVHIRKGLPFIPIEETRMWSEKMTLESDQYADDWIPWPFPHSDAAFVTKVSGQSMFDPTGEKSYSDGNFIAIDPMKEPRHLSLVLVAPTGTGPAIFRQLLIEADGSRFLQALNPSWPKRIVEMEDEDQIIGVVIGKWVPEEQ